MNKNEFSPYIRVAMFSTLTAPFRINKRIIFDYEIIFVKDGECKITIEDTEYICRKNDVVFLRPGISHKFECLENIDFVQPHIHFDVLYDIRSEETFVSFKPKEKMTAYELSLIRDDVFKDTRIPYIFKPDDIYNFKKIFFEVIELFQKKPYNHELLCKAKMLELLDCILTQFESERAIKSAIADDSVATVKEYIDNNYLSVMTLESLSKQFYYNKYTLIRKFKSMYKQNIISYYRSRRIEYAKKLLEENTLSVCAISEKLNFSDIYSFSRFFKTYVGISPTVYRKRHIKQ